MALASDTLIKWFVPGSQEPLTQEVRVRFGFLQAYVSISGNVILTVVKFMLGLITNSIALMADAFHTLSDVLTSAVVLVGFRMARKPADLQHPYGHGRMEPIATLIIALLLIWVGIEFGHASYHRLLRPPTVTWSLVAFIVMLLSALFKEWLARFAIQLAHRIDSDMLKADAWHHRSDAIASFLVAISLVTAHWGYQRIDAFFGFGVAALIIYTGFDLVRSMVNTLMGQAPSENVLAHIIQAAFSIEGVKGVHDVEVHDYGAHKVISLHINTLGSLSTESSHRLAQAVENAVSNSLNASTVVHVDPLVSKASSLKYTKVENALNKIINQHPEVYSFHGLTVSEQGQPKSISLHLVLDGETRTEDSHRIAHQIMEKLEKKMVGYEINIHVEPNVKFQSSNDK
ncbi:MAG: cation-efflux pump [candidate division KSB1 bacterium]|nr:cation-efflux pump [candidate division KSB1 bacterium]